MPTGLLLFLVLMLLPSLAVAQPATPVTPAPHAGGEASLALPDLALVVAGFDARAILAVGLAVAALGVACGLWMLRDIRRLPTHASMAAVADVIYETCKTYLWSQGRFILLLELFVGAVVVLYFGVLLHFDALRVAVILLFSLVGIAGSYGVAWFGIRINTLANSRAAFASLAGRPFPLSAIPLRAGMSIGMLLISVELFLMLCILLFVPGAYAGACFLGFAIGESLGAAALRIAGGIFTKIADIGADLMKIAFQIKEDDARNPGVIADCVGDNAGDSIGPSADGFETYGVTGVALITFIVLAVAAPAMQVTLLVWMFALRAAMVAVSALSYFANSLLARARWGRAAEMNFEAPLTWLVWLTSLLSVAVTYVVSAFLLRDVGEPTLWWRLASIVTCGTLAGAIIPELVKVFTSTGSGHVREVVASSREGGASLNILSGMVAGTFSAFWLGLAIVALMAVASMVGGRALDGLMVGAPVFAFGLVAFGFLGMGPVTIAVDSYGPVTDNAQSIFELSLIEQEAGVRDEVRAAHGFEVDFARAKRLLEQNDGAGNTFKATAKPVLIGTAVVGATTMIFSIVMLLTQGLTGNLDRLSLLHPPFFLGLVTGGAVVFWFTGATMQAVTTGAYRAVEFIKANIRLDGAARASVEDSRAVVGICTQYAQHGMLNIFVAVFFITLAFAFVDPYFFIGYLVSMALFGLFQAIFLANAGGAWDNAKKIVEVELQASGTPLHAAAVIGDTVGDPFKDTSSVALNPVIKFTTLFGLLAVELGLSLSARLGAPAAYALSAAFLVVSLGFVWRSFYGMRIPAARTGARMATPIGAELQRESGL